MAHVVRIKRVYEPPQTGDGVRVLVDWLWPRGVAKAEAQVDLWLKEVAPSAELRTWFAHAPELWPEFRRRYEAELAANPAFAELRALAAQSDLTLVYAAKDEARNNAVVLAERLGARRA